LLSGGLLLKALKGGEAFAGLVVLAASLSGQRTVAVPGIDLETFETEFRNVAAKAASSRLYSTVFKPLGKTSMTSDKMVAGGSLATMGEEVQNALDETHAATNAGFSEVQTLLKEMANDLSEARQEVEMLWWLTGGWLERPFSDLGIPLGAVAAGFDLADLSLTMHGPYAAEAILTRALSGINEPKKSVTLAEVGDSPTVEEFDRLAVSKHVTEYPDICPLSAALAKSAEIGKGTAWHQSFEKNAHAKPGASLTPIEISVQAMRERLLSSNL
jgi:GTPase-associated system helical domain